MNPYRKREKSRGQRDTQVECHVMKEAETSDTAASQRTPRTDGHHQKLGRGPEGLCPSEGALPCLASGLLDNSRTMTQYIFVDLSHPARDTLL